MWHAHRTDALAVVAAHSVRDHVQALLSDGDVDGAWAVATDDLPCYRGFALQALKVSDRVAYRECVR